jgi:hypothetical protein
MSRIPLTIPGTVARCHNHPRSSRLYRAVAPVEIRPGVFVCHACSAEDRVRAMGIPSLRTRELGARHLVRSIVVAILVTLCGSLRAKEPAPGSSLGVQMDTPWTAQNGSLFSAVEHGVRVCRVGVDLKVHGDSTLACVEWLETAARLARAEMRVNDGIRRKKLRR